MINFKYKAGLIKKSYLQLVLPGTLCLLLLYPVCFFAQSPWLALAQKPSTLGLEEGLITLQTPSFSLKLVKASQTVAALSPANEPQFDFTPGDSLKVRSSNGLYHLGDLNLRLRTSIAEDWKIYSTAVQRRPVKALPAIGSILAAADLSATLPADMPLHIKRSWEVIDSQLVLRFELTNQTIKPVEIGALGIPMVFNNILEGKTLEQDHAQNVFYDPYIGQDAGYLQVMRLDGRSTSLLVVPYSYTPFEAYNPLLDDPTPRGIVFEGFYEWQVCSKAYAETEWKQAKPWNQPNSLTLQPGETKRVGVRLLLTGTARDIENTLLRNSRPVVVGVPGYAVPQDVNAKLFLNYKMEVRSIAVEPKDALEIAPALPAKNGWKAYAVNGKKWGRARVTITYEDGLVQTVHYKIIKPEKETIQAYGNFLTTKQWFEKEGDPFGRSPSVISYDNGKGAQVTQDNRGLDRRPE